MEGVAQTFAILVVALLGGLIPTVLYVLGIWWLDRYEKEPIWLLALGFAWGLIPAALLLVLFELLFDLPVTAIGGETLAANLVSTAIGAPLIEESFKALALLGLVLAFHQEFDDVLDGIIYGAMIGLGFAMTENVLGYYLPILQAEGISAGLVNILMRSVVFGVNHAFWTAIVGAAIGYARLVPGWGQRLVIVAGGWSLAVFFHAVHNAGATLVEHVGCLSLGISLVSTWGGVLGLIVVAGLALRKESEWICDGLQEELRSGLLTSRERDLLSSAGRRFRLRWGARRRGGSQAYRAVGRYFQCATELAFKKHHLRSMRELGGHRSEIERLRRELAERRQEASPWLWPGDA